MMTWETTLLLVAFFGLMLFPFLPGLIELLNPVDDEPLAIDMEYIREARYFGITFRRRIDEQMSKQAMGAGAMGSGRIQPLVTIGRGTQTSGLIAALDHIEIGENCNFGEAYCYGDVQIGADSTFESAASDGRMVIEDNCTVHRWVDSEQDMAIGTGCVLGVSASSAQSLIVGDRCEFQRLWGLPVRTSEEPISRYVPDLPQEREEIIGKDTGIEIEDTARWSSGDLTVPAGSTVGRDIVAYGDVRIGANAIVLGTVKGRGRVTLDEGVIVTGNVIGQRGINCIGNASVFGNMFSERDIELGPGTVVGRTEAFKTIYSQTRVLLARGVEVYGWIVAEEGGTVG